MKIKYYFLFAILALSACTTDQKENQDNNYNTARAYGYLGDLKSVKRTTYSRVTDNFGEWMPTPGTDSFLTIINFDQTGRLITLEVLDESYHNIFNYSYQTTDSGLVEQKINTKHNDTSHTVFINKDNKTWRIRQYNSENELIKEAEEQLDDRGFVVKSEEKNPMTNNSPETWVEVTNTFDNKGLQTLMVVENKIEKTTDTTTIDVIKTDSYNNPLIQINHRANGSTYMSAFEYSYYR